MGWKRLIDIIVGSMSLPVEFCPVVSAGYKQQSRVAG